MWPWKWISQIHWKSVSFLCCYAESQIRLNYVTVHEDGGLIFASVCVLITCYFFLSYYPSYAIWWIDFFPVLSLLAVDSTGICTHDTAMSTSDVEYRIIPVIPWFGLEGACKGHLVQPLSSGGTALPRSGYSELGQCDLECFQEWSIHHLSGQPVLCFITVTVKEFHPNI